MRQYTIGMRVHLRSDKTRAVHTITHIIVRLDMFDQVNALFFWITVLSMPGRLKLSRR